MDDRTQKQMEEIYGTMPLEEIPWNQEEPPELLVELVESGKIRKGRALDLGCGAGNYAIWLAGRGFDATGIDISPTAIKIARENAKRKKVRCKFIVADVIEGAGDIEGPFDFVYDWGLLHHIFPEKRPKYVENVHGALKGGGRYLSVCFNEKDTAFEGRGKYRKTKLGGRVYLSSEMELRRLFEAVFEIIDFRVLEVTGKVMTHIFNYCFMGKK